MAEKADNFDNNEKIKTSIFSSEMQIDENKEGKEDINPFPNVIEDSAETPKKGLRKDLKTISLLMYLYFMQGLPLGLAGCIPIIMMSKKASFSDQGTFSFVLWPFSLKLLWAPIVDSIFIKRFGRRKSWLIPVQLLIGMFMITSAYTVESFLYNIQSKKGSI